MKKFFAVLVVSLVSFSIFAPASMAGIAIAFKNCDFQVRNGALEVTVTVKDPDTPRVFPVAENQVTVVWKRGDLYEIAVHKKGATWYEETHILYYITPEKLTAVEAGITVDWTKMEKL